MQELRILHLEDNAAEAKLLRQRLLDDGIVCRVTRVDTEAAFREALAQTPFDLILSDFRLPSFDGGQALKLAQESCPEAPFIIVSGALGEELAIELLKAGATDYVLKQNPERLAPAARRAIHEARNRAEKKRAQQALRESEARFRQLADAMPQIVWIGDIDGTISYFNQRWYEYTGCPPGECSPESWLPVLHPDDRSRTVERWLQSTRTGEPYEIEYRFRERSGEFRWHLARALPVRDDAGKIVRWYGTSTDIDDQKRAEKSLLEADRRKDEFLAMLAHELRNPLAPISNGVHVLQMIGSPAPEFQAATEVIERQVQHMTRLVDDLLDVSRITRGVVALRTLRLELSTVVQRGVETSQPLIDAGRHELIVSQPAPVFVEADGARLSQVVANLLNNSAKYMNPGGKIHLSVEAAGDHAVIRVRDTGLGIPPEMLPKVFDLFTQVDHSLARSQGGLGIGLTLVRSLVEMHGGQVEAHSEGVGRGSEFIVRLPLAAPIANAQRATLPDSVPGASARRVLVVDDNVDSARTLQLWLSRSGHAAHVAHDGPEALRTAKITLPEIVLLDIGLPGMNGYEVAERLRGDPDLQKILLVAMTGYGQDEDLRRSRQAGFDRHLVKPLDIQALRDILAAP